MQSLLLNDVPRAAQAVAQSSRNRGRRGDAARCSSSLTAAPVASADIGRARDSSAVGSLLAMRLDPPRRAQRWRWSRAARASTGSGFRLHAGLKAALAQGTVAQFLDEYRVEPRRTRGRDRTLFARDLSAARQLRRVRGAVAAALLLFVGVRVLALPFPVLVTSLDPVRPHGRPRSCSSNRPSLRPMRRLRGDRAAPGRAEPRPRAAHAGRATRDGAELALEGVAFEHRPGLAPTASLALRAASGSGSAVLRAPARRPCSTSSPGCSRRRRAQSRSTASR